MKRTYLNVLVIATVGLLVVIGAILYTKAKNHKIQGISSFEECTAMGYPVLEMHPSQCKTPDGRTFTASVQSVTPVTELTPSQQVDGQSQAEHAAQAQLAKDLSINVATISILSTTPTQWPDGCLGVYKKDVMCTQAIVPGYEIGMQTSGTEYTYRTNSDGSLVVAAQPAEK